MPVTTHYRKGKLRRRFVCPKHNLRTIVGKLCMKCQETKYINQQIKLIQNQAPPAKAEVIDVDPVVD